MPNDPAAARSRTWLGWTLAAWLLQACGEPTTETLAPEPPSPAVEPAPVAPAPVEPRVEPVERLEPTTDEPLPAAPEPPSPNPAPAPANVAPALPHVAIGEGDGCAIEADGAVWCFPLPDQRDRTERVEARRVDGVSDARTIAVAGDARCVVNTAHEVVCWGTLGHGGGRLAWPTPTVVAELPDARAVALGRSQVCALDGAGAVLCRGQADRRRDTVTTDTLAVGPSIALVAGHRSLCTFGASGPPLCDDGLGRMSAPHLAAASVRAVSIATTHVCVLEGEGTQTWCWGEIGSWFYEDIEWDDEERGSVNAMEQSVGEGEGSLTLPWTATSITSAYDHACALSRSGAVACWGTAFRNGRTEGFEVVPARSLHGVTELAGGGDPVGVTCAVRGGELVCFSGRGWLGNRRPGEDVFPVCRASVAGCDPLRPMGGALASASPPAPIAVDASSCTVHDESGTPLNVRAEASGRAEVLGTVANDTVVHVLESRGPWRRIDGSTPGWVYGAALRCP